MPGIRASKMPFIILNSVHNHHILVTGANGQVGMEIRNLVRMQTSHTFTFLGKEDLPIENVEEVRDFFVIASPTVVINCAAYTAVDKAESEQVLAYQVNAEAVGLLAAVSKEYNARFIHISTDYVFDGNATEPYKETDKVSKTDAMNILSTRKSLFPLVRLIK